MSKKLLIVGARGGTNVGESLLVSADSQGIAASLLDVADAWRGPWLLKKLYWHGLGHRPLRLAAFSREVSRSVEETRPDWLLSVGLAPLDARTLRSLRERGLRTLNFLTDDPWNPAHRAPWVLRALCEYACVISPRRGNMADLKSLGCREVRYVPFGFDPRHFFPEPQEPALASDVIFVGGADADRAPWVKALFDAGISVALYGNYWDRYPETRGRSRGQARPEVIRRATASAKLAVCLVRRANRDGHVMRSLEIPATGTCMLAEDTDEHRELFGPEDECVVYFKTPQDMVDKAQALLHDEPRRLRLARAGHARVTNGSYTYAARLAEMLELG